MSPGSGLLTTDAWTSWLTCYVSSSVRRIETSFDICAQTHSCLQFYCCTGNSTYNRGKSLPETNAGRNIRFWGALLMRLVYNTIKSDIKTFIGLNICTHCHPPPIANIAVSVLSSIDRATVWWHWGQQYFQVEILISLDSQARATQQRHRLRLHWCDILDAMQMHVDVD